MIAVLTLFNFDLLFAMSEVLAKDISVYQTGFLSSLQNKMEMSLDKTICFSCWLLSLVWRILKQLFNSMSVNTPSYWLKCDTGGLQ